MSFWGERRVAVEHLLSPRLLRMTVLPLQFPLSRLFLRQLTEEEPSRKKVACISPQACPVKNAGDAARYGSVGIVGRIP